MAAGAAWRALAAAVIVVALVAMPVAAVYTLTECAHVEGGCLPSRC